MFKAHLLPNVYLINPIDFYDFQINLLNDFPVEAGKEDRERILPYMPGPLTDVDEDITGNYKKDKGYPAFRTRVADPFSSS